MRLQSQRCHLDLDRRGRQLPGPDIQQCGARVNTLKYVVENAWLVGSVAQPLQRGVVLCAHRGASGPSASKAVLAAKPPSGNGKSGVNAWETSWQLASTSIMVGTSFRNSTTSSVMSSAHTS